MFNSYLHGMFIDYIEKRSARIGYVVNDIEVINENEPSYCTDVSQYSILQGYKSKSIFLFQNENLADEIKTIDCVDSVSVRKIFPSKVELKIIYKIPVAVWYDHGKFYFVTKDGNVISIRQPIGLEKFIFISGENAPKNVPTLMSFITLDQGVYDKIEKAVWVSNRRWNIIFTSGVKILLPEENPEAAWNKFVNLQKTHSDFVDWKFKVVDFRVLNKVYVR